MGYQLDKQHAEVGFSVKHLMISTVKGKFKTFDATVDFDPAAIEKAKVEASVDTASIETHEPQRDAHLRSGDFFDSEKYPKMTFKSTKVSKDGDDVEVGGDLTIRDVTKPIVLKGTFEGPVKDPWGGQRYGFSLNGEVDREAFGLTWNAALETGGVVVGKKVKIHLEGELIAK